MFFVGRASRRGRESARPTRYRKEKIDMRMKHADMTMSKFVIIVAVCLMWVNVAQAKQNNRRPTLALYCGGDNNTLDKAIENNIKILYPSIYWWLPNTDMKSFVDKAHRHGIKVYPSLATAIDAVKSNGSTHDFARNNPQCIEKRRDGTLIDLNHDSAANLSWGYPEVREYKIKTITRLVANIGFDGILLDYTRFMGSKAGYSEIIVQDFKEKTGRDAFAIPFDDPEWIKFRADYVTTFLTQLRRSLKSHNKSTEIIVCVGPDPEECLKDRMQDWKKWLDEGLIDGVVIMIYERDTNDTIAKIMTAQKAINSRVPLTPLIACWGGNLETPHMLKEGTEKCLQMHTDGVGFYRSDAINELELWPTLKEISQWKLDDISTQPINYVLNNGFENDLECWSIGYGQGIAISGNKVKSGRKSLKITFPADVASFRQIVNSGLLLEKNTLQLSAWMNSSNLSHSNAVGILINAHYKSGEDDNFRIPIISSTEGWHEITAALPIRRSNDLQYIIVGITGSGKTGNLYVDDLTVSLKNSSTTETPYALPPQKSAMTIPQGVNIARGQIVIGSSFWDNSYRYSNAVDGDISNKVGSMWHSQRPAKDQWIVICLPQTYKVSRFRMLNSSLQYAYRTKAYKIEVSEDNVNFIQVAKGTMPNDAESWTEVEIAPKAARYIRFTGLTGYHSDYAIGLKEIEVY